MKGARVRFVALDLVSVTCERIADVFKAASANVRLLATDAESEIALEQIRAVGHRETPPQDPLTPEAAELLHLESTRAGVEQYADAPLSVDARLAYEMGKENEPVVIARRVRRG